MIQKCLVSVPDAAAKISSSFVPLIRFLGASTLSITVWSAVMLSVVAPFFVVTANSPTIVFHEG
jgi:hypothetical protein